MNLHLLAAFTVTFVASAATLPLGAQTPEEFNAPKFVMRVSRPFLARLTEKQFGREDPIRDYILGVSVEGRAQIDGRFSLKLQQDEKIDGFILLVQGHVADRSIARRRGIAAHIQGLAKFTADRPVIFNGKEFVGQPVGVEVDYHSRLEGVSARRSGLLGRVATRIAFPSVVKRMPDGERIAERKLREHLRTAITQESDEVLVTLNRVTAIASTLFLLQKAWSSSEQELAIRLAASDQYLHMGIAASDLALAELPMLSEEDRAPVEVWIHKLGKTKELDSLSALRVYWLGLGPILKISLAQAAPDLADVLDNVQVTELTEWRVVRFYLNPVKNHPAKP